MNPARLFVSGMAEQISMPDVYVAIRKLLLDPDASIDDFVRVVEADSMLALRVLRMAQSAYFGFPRRCTTVRQAIGLIGLVQLHDLLLGLLCMRTFSAVPAEMLNLEEFWRYNVQCGIAARTIARFSRAEGHQVFFTLGLLHEIGHASMFLKVPDASLRALDDSLSGCRTVAEAERDYLGFDYAQVGAEIMQLWQLPPIYRQVAACHLEPRTADRQYWPAVAIVHLAHEFCQDPRPGRHAALIRRSAVDHPLFLRLPDDIDRILVREIATHTEPVLDLLWPTAAADPAVQQQAPGHG